MAARRVGGLLTSLAKVADRQLLTAQGIKCTACSLNSITQPFLVGRSSLPQRSLWNGWKIGFSSSSSAPAQDGKPAAEGDEASAAGDAAADGHEDATEGLQSIEELRKALAASQETVAKEHKQAEEFKEKLVRTLADMENLRERTARQTSEARQFAVQGLVQSLVEVADNLERAAGSVPPADVESPDSMDLERALSLLRSLRDGVAMTDGILMKILAKEGVTRYDPMGQQFDPNMHNALFEVPDGTKEPGTVAVVIKKGYMLHDRAVRAAEVGVVKAMDEE